jgi:hypothetical protein
MVLTETFVDIIKNLNVNNRKKGLLKKRTLLGYPLLAFNFSKQMGRISDIPLKPKFP